MRPDMWNSLDFIKPPTEWRNDRVQRWWKQAMVDAESRAYRREDSTRLGGSGKLTTVAGAFSEREE
jgi:hypothetical protein